jgi:hypothetical protein
MLKISMRDDRELEEKAKSDIKHIREAAKKEPLLLKKLKEYGFGKDLIDSVSVQFVDLDVSAKTINGKIYLNAEMLKKPWQDYYSYFAHEICHSAQHRSGDCAGDSKDVPYLDNPAEVEAFQTQIKVREKYEPKEDVIEYVEDLMDKHDTPKDERADKKKELMGK